MADQSQAGAVHSLAASESESLTVVVCRAFAWCNVAALFAFVLNNYLDFWRDWPGAMAAFGGAQPGTAVLAWGQLALYVVGLGAAIAYVVSTRARPLRPDSGRIYAVTAYIVRAAFWAVLLIGIADMVVSFLRVEGFLPALFGDQVALDLGRSSFRGVWVHFPMIAIGIVIATFNRRGLGFHWLALLVVAAEMLIVISRFIFSYEQAFMADLVRFWYGALFLFASAYTLLEEGHVRVDVLYAGFSDRTKGIVNAIGSVVLGMSLCWVILIYGMGSGSTIINGPLLSFEVTQTGFGAYVKYWMAGFLGIFAITMLLQFSGYFLESVADFRGEPGKRQLETAPAGHEEYEV
jgi:TRAP-type mannitol/chloroaromatic compound transport system permease small subunit